MWFYFLLLKNEDGIFFFIQYKLNGFRFMVFNATFYNISVISWWSALLVEETRVPGENHRPDASHRQTSSHNVVHCIEYTLP